MFNRKVEKQKKQIKISRRRLEVMMAVKDIKIPVTVILPEFKSLKRSLGSNWLFQESNLKINFYRCIPETFL